VATLLLTPRAIAPAAFAWAGVTLGVASRDDGWAPPEGRAPRSEDGADPARAEGSGREGLAPPATGPRPGLALLAGRIASMPSRLDDRVRFTLDTDAVGRVELLCPDLAEGAPLALGDRVLVEAELRAPPGPRNPGGRDRASLLAARGIRLEGTARAPPLRAAPPSPLSRLEAARIRFGREAGRRLGRDEAALVRAIGAGDESAMDPGVREAFARSGLAHVLSVSGLHLAVVAWGAWRAARGAILRLDRAQRLDARRWAAAAAIPVAAAYALATGASVPAVRSAIGAGLGLAAALAGREADPRNALALAAMLVLAADPGALRDVSFQLSFAAVAGLLLVAGELRRGIPLRPDRGRWHGRAAEAAIGAACASAAATLATAPLLALHFRQLSVLAIPANVVGLPLASLLTALGATAFLASAAAPSLAPLALWACRAPAAGLLAVNAAFAAPPWSTVSLASPGWAGAAASAALGLAALRLHGLARGAALAGAVAALALPGPARRLAALHAGRLEVVFLSVGQGDAAVLRLPGGEAVLVDAGGDDRGRHDPGSRDVRPFLLDMGVRRLAAAFVSHLHGDHALGLPGVAAGVEVERVYAPARAAARAGDEAVAEAMRRLPRAVPLAAGDQVAFGGVRFEVLGPPRPEAAAGLADNDASLVLRVVHGRTAFLFPGDVEAEGEALAARHGTLAADVVKVPHHGSRTSSGRGLAAAVVPRWAVVSVGRRNRFAFPHAEAVERWREVGAEVLRTDEGPARFLSDGRAVWRADPAAAHDAVELWAGR
jgi:competence protein ComEC